MTTTQPDTRSHPPAPMPTTSKPPTNGNGNGNGIAMHDVAFANTFINIRCPVAMAIGLRRAALARQTDVSVLVRQAISEWAERNGVNLTIP